MFEKSIKELKQTFATGKMYTFQLSKFYVAKKKYFLIRKNTTEGSSPLGIFGMNSKLLNIKRDRHVKLVINSILTMKT